MLEKEKYYRLKLFKKIFLISFLIINFSIQNSFAFSNQSRIKVVKKIKENLIKTNSLSFLFKQRVGKKIEVGECLAKYPKLMHCYYDNKEKKPFDPYKILPDTYRTLDASKHNLLFKDAKVQDGGAALAAFGKMQFMEMSAPEKSALVSALLQYCELDTLAMVMLYQHWISLKD